MLSLLRQLIGEGRTRNARRLDCTRGTGAGARKALLLLTLAAAYLALAAPASAQQSTTCSVDAQGQRYVHVAASFGRTEADVARAVELANRDRCNLYFAEGTFEYRTFTLQGIRASGHGESTVLSAVDPAASSISLRGSGPALLSLKITSPLASTRAATHESNGVTVKEDATSFLIDHVVVDRVAGAGIHNFGGTDGRITSNVVRNTLADGIHNAFGARNVLIWGNTVANTGDDFISVVSYSFDPRISSDITIENNVVGTNPHGRGIAVVGGSRVKVLRNRISGSQGAGIYIASEPGSLATMEVDDVTVSDNVVREPDRGNIHAANILVWSGHRSVQNVTGEGNNVDSATTHYDGSVGTKQTVRVLNQDCATCATSNISLTAYYGT